MGTKLGNLHIRNATVEEVAPLLPGAIVGQWAEGFVSAYSEEYQWGSVEQAGKKLSRKLPAATVLTAALFDSDVVSFEVYEAGKRLTAHLLNPYEDINRAGNPKVFCEALGLPPEDEKRLRTLWKKGDAEEQLELTGALLGLPLYHDPEVMPKEPARRDTETVDTWIAQRPDPPKVKSVTKAELLQEESGFVIAGAENSEYIFSANATEYGHSITDGWLYRYTSEGPLVRETRTDWPYEVKYPQEMLGETVCYSIGQNRVLWCYTIMKSTDDRNDGWSCWGVRVIWDSAGLLDLPLDIEGTVHRIWSTPDGGIGVVTTEWPEWPDLSGSSLNVLIRYAPNGSRSYRKELPKEAWNWVWLDNGFYAISPKGEMLFFDWEGNQIFRMENPIPPYSRYCGMAGEDILLLCREDKSHYLSQGDYFISRRDKTGHELARSPIMSGPIISQEDVRDAEDGKHIFVLMYKERFFLLDRETMEIVWQQPRKEFIFWCRVDGKGRRWLKVESSTLEGYDPAGNLVSRHRLKGEIMNTRLDQSGRLIAYTYHYNTRTLRVYRIA